MGNVDLSVECAVFSSLAKVLLKFVLAIGARQSQPAGHSDFFVFVYFCHITRVCC